eukprot:gene4126-4453_t
MAFTSASRSPFRFPRSVSGVVKKLPAGRLFQITTADAMATNHMSKRLEALVGTMPKDEVYGLNLECLKDLDLAVLKDYPRLEDVNAGLCQLTSLQPLPAAAKGLLRLEVADNQLSDLSPLAHLDKLECLDLANKKAVPTTRFPKCTSSSPCWVKSVGQLPVQCHRACVAADPLPSPCHLKHNVDHPPGANPLGTAVPPDKQDTRKAIFELLPQLK